MMTDNPRRSNTMTLADGSKLSVGDRFIWRNIFGIGGAVVAGKVTSVWSNGNVYSTAAWLNIEPSATLAQIANWFKEINLVSTRLPVVATGVDGPYAVSYDEIWTASYRGNLRLATGTEEEAASLTKMPDWWATRREDFAKQEAEEKDIETGRKALFNILVKLTAMFALAEDIPEESDTVRASGNTTCHVCRFELWRHATDPREPDVTITCSGRVHL